MTIGATLLPAIDALATQVAAAGSALADLRAAAAALDPPLKPTGIRSGLPWASGKRQGSIFRSVLEPATASFEEMRGRPSDFELVFVDNWKNSTASTWMAGCNALKPASALPWLASQGVAVVLTVPLFPNGGLAGVLPAGKARVRGRGRGRVRRGAPGARGRDRGLRRRGDRPRVGWEANGGFPWCHQFCEGDYALWRGAYKRVAGLWKARFPRALVSLNFLRSFAVTAPSPAFSLDTLLQGDLGWFDVLGADCYTNQLRAGATPADVRAYLNAGTPEPAARPGDVGRGGRGAGQVLRVQRVGGGPAGVPGRRPTRDVAAFPPRCSTTSSPRIRPGRRTSRPTTPAARARRVRASTTSTRGRSCRTRGPATSAVGRRPSERRPRRWAASGGGLPPDGNAGRSGVSRRGASRPADGSRGSACRGREARGGRGRPSPRGRGKSRSHSSGTRAGPTCSPACLRR